MWARYSVGDQGLFQVDGTAVIPVPTPAPPRAMDACGDALWIATEGDLFVSHDGEHFTPRH